MGRIRTNLHRYASKELDSIIQHQFDLSNRLIIISLAIVVPVCESFEDAMTTTDTARSPCPDGEHSYHGLDHVRFYCSDSNTWVSLDGECTGKYLKL